MLGQFFYSTPVMVSWWSDVTPSLVTIEEIMRLPSITVVSPAVEMQQPIATVQFASLTIRYVGMLYFV